jgi:hypothetical protein
MSEHRRESECPTADPARWEESSGDHRDQPVGDHDDGTGLDAYISSMIDHAPPLTSEQRDTLALLLRTRHRRTLAHHMRMPRRPVTAVGASACRRRPA